MLVLSYARFCGAEVLCCCRHAHVTSPASHAVLASTMHTAGGDPCSCVQAGFGAGSGSASGYDAASYGTNSGYDASQSGYGQQASGYSQPAYSAAQASHTSCPEHMVCIDDNDAHP